MSAVAHGNLEAQLPKFGLAGFRPGQRDVIEAVMGGEDCLLVMPTGGGKSLCYQLPAVAREGLVLVVSPLISLMKDQVDQLTKLGLRATFINSSLDQGEQHARMDQMLAGQWDLVYCAAERFRSGRFIEYVQRSKLQLLAIDEAHCISEWGHDFRPDYAKLGRFRAKLGNPPTIALTATATDAVRRDIIEQLSLRQPRTFITGFARPNLRLEVLATGSQPEKDEALIAFLAANPGSGIIYVSSRKRCDEVADTVRQRAGRSAGVYHAGMPNDDRRRAQEAFMSGKAQIVVATTAFGMGIDKSDVRFVVHYNLPGTLEAYYQEAGRAGRDGLPSRCLLLYSAGDRFIQEFFIESAYPSPRIVQTVYEFLKNIPEDPIELTQQEIKERLALEQLSSEGVGTCERLLEKAGVLERLEPRQNMALVRLDSDLPTLVDILPKAAVVQRRVLQQVERIVGRRRNEMVYFQPRELCQALEMEMVDVTRHLRELRKNLTQYFDYVPPFRGRAVHMLERSKSFGELEIDFETLEKRKLEEYDKLERVIQFARTRSCRQLEILRYFGQEDAQACGNCDNCEGQEGGAARGFVSETPQGPVLEAVRIVLSGVARTHGRFGKLVVAQMLCGATTAKVTKFRLDRLSTYGLLSHLKQAEVTHLIDALIHAGCLEQSHVDRFRPILQLTDLGSSVMRGQAALDSGLSLPAQLYRKLGGSAKAASKKKGADKPEAAIDVPAPTPPASTEEPVAVEAAIEAPAAKPLLEDPRVLAHNEAVAQPSYYWTWRLLATGFSPAESAVIRGIEPGVVLDHALRAIEAGLAVEMSWFLTPETIARMVEVIGEVDPQRIRPLMARLPRGTRYEEVLLYLKCRKASGR